MKPNIGITANNTQEVAQILSKLLADEFVLYAKTRNAHWNVEGPDFMDKHKFFESQYEQLDDFMDQVAERIRKIGHYAPATLKSFLELTHLTEARQQETDAKNFIKDLLGDHENIVIYLRENIDPVASKFKDIGTSDFLTGLLRDHEQMAWFLRAHFA
ncbi:MAG: DNA starvation/stationary phase protection protein [Bacteroidetes bacterium]|nr:MAG: DNA starvation/stationary phase protection protein [Bacteroidota bacterium]